MSLMKTALRRRKVYGARVKYTLPFVPKLKRNIAFMHMPKCAGTSLSNALYSLVPLQKRVGVIDANATRLAAGILQHNVVDRLACHEDKNDPKPCFDIREIELINHMCWNTQLIHGHFLWSDLAYAHYHSNYDFITMLRHPIDRALSNFRMNKDRGIIPNDFTIDDWLSSDLGFHHGSTYLRYFSGNAILPCQNANDFLEISFENAKKFKLIGCIEDQSSFVKNFKKLYGPRLSIGRHNTAKAMAVSLSEKQSSKLKELCRFDISIYDYFRDWKIENG